MPIGFSPDETFWVKCEDIEGVEFAVKALSVAQVRAIRKAFDETRAENVTAEDENRILNDAILSAVTGWRPNPSGFPVPTSEALDNALTLSQKYMLLVSLPSMASIGEREKKALRLQRKSDAESSASNAAASA